MTVRVAIGPGLCMVLMPLDFSSAERMQAGWTKMPAWSRSFIPRDGEGCSCADSVARSVVNVVTTDLER